MSEAERLARMQRRLGAMYGLLVTLPCCGVGSSLEQRFLALLDRMDWEERIARDAGVVTGCINGSGCPADAVVTCEGCTGAPGA